MIQLGSFFSLLMVTICSAFMVGCIANPLKKEALTVMDSAKVNFHYVKTDTGHLGDKSPNKDFYTLSVFMDIENNKISFESESINSAGVGWNDNYALYQELECQEYSYDYLCVPSIKLTLPINEFQSKNTWSHGFLNYTNKGIQSISSLNQYGPVFVINASQLSNNKLIYTYYLTLNKGLVAFSKGDSRNPWVLSEENEFGVGALSLGASINANALTTSDIKNYSIIKMAK
ncbi:hypothetical protein [Shewanella colwelliana]|uniref:hypothetical protein n=1 Tax=Shewanella colwelliana TaxID=23 RepID=UPI0037357ED5